MELEQQDERRESNRQDAQPVTSRNEHAAVSPPLAGGGLEQVRDSHC